MRVGLPLLFLLTLVACEEDGPHSLTWRFTFEDDAARDRAVAIETRVLVDGCTGSAVYDGEIRRDIGAPAPPRLAAGTFALTGRARDASCVWFAEVCEVVTLPRDGEIMLTLSAVAERAACPPEECIAASCAGASTDGGPPGRDAEVPDGCVPTAETCDGADQDCDGAADEDFDLSTDPEHCGACGTTCATGTCATGVCGPAANDVVETIAGGGHSCVRLGSGQVWCWGWNHQGQLGDGTTTDRAAPARVPGLDDATDLTLGGHHSCALRGDGSVACWGSNGGGQLGDGTAANRSSPTPVATLDDAIAVRAGGFHTCAIRPMGRLACWGLNNEGQLGAGDTANRAVVTAVPGMLDVTHVSANYQSTCAIDAGSTVYCWGQNPQGQVGDGTVGTSRSDPTRVVDLLAPAVGVASGLAHACAVLADGTAHCWGEGRFGALGNGSGADQPRPIAVTGLDDAIAIRAGNGFTCARRSSNEVACWGTNLQGELGDGTMASRMIPGMVTGERDVVALSEILHDHACVLDSRRALRCWRHNDRGQIGPGGMGTTVTSPTTVTGLP